MRKFEVMLPVPQLMLLSALAKNLDVSKAELVRQALSLFFKQQDPRNLALTIESGKTARRNQHAA